MVAGIVPHFPRRSRATGVNRNTYSGIIEREPSNMLMTNTETTRREETVDEFLARGGRIERVEHYPDPEGRVLLRGQREHQRQSNLCIFLSRKDLH